MKRKPMKRPKPQLEDDKPPSTHDEIEHFFELIRDPDPQKDKANRDYAIALIEQSAWTKR